MYTNLRQLPHLLDKSEAEIAQISAQSLDRNPLLKSIAMMRVFVISLAAAASAYLLRQYTELPWGWILGSVVAVSGAVIVLWHLIWLNCVMFKLTHTEVSNPHDPPAGKKL